MKKGIITLALFAITILTKAQVGINTTNPQGTFHIDGAKDNAATGAPTATQQANDLIVTSAGNVGVGKINPTNKLEISSGTAGVSGLTFTNMNNTTSPTANAANLGIDSSGKVVVVTAPSQKAIVRAQISTTSLPANGSASSGPFTILDLTENIDLNGNLSGKEFTATRDGYYNVYANLVLAQSNNWGAQTELYMDVVVNGSTVSIANTNVFSTTSVSEVQGPMVSLSGILKLSAGDKVTFRAWMNNANVARNIQTGRTTMSIFEL